MNAIINNIPYFEVGGKKYVIKRTRYLQAEFDEMKRRASIDDNDDIEYIREKELIEQANRLGERKEELYEKFLETFSDEDEAKYNKACEAYDKLLVRLSETKGVIAKNRRQMMDIGVEIILKSLQTNEDGETIRTEDEAKNIWHDFRVEFGDMIVNDFIIFTLNYIIGNDEENENPFIAQAKAKAEQKANMKKGISKAR